MPERSDNDPTTRPSDRSDAGPRAQPTDPPESSIPATGGTREPRAPSGRQDSTSRGRIGSIARRTLVTILVVAVLSVTVLGLGFLVYRGSVSPGPFLLLVGIVVGFVLGRLDAVL